MQEKVERSAEDTTRSVDISLAESPDELENIFKMLHERIGHDFSCYKKNTILRRIQKRMVVRHLESLADYHFYLQENKNELKLLFEELVIGVTGFFRDPNTFTILENEILPQFFAELPASYTVRIWVPGCSTGEEAYSLAIIIHEYMQKHAQPLDFKIFATDINPQAIDKARRGVFAASIIQDVSKARLERFFVKKGSEYKIVKKIRDMLIFATHDLIRDPPFSQIDIISCRNLLIYLDSRAQQKVLTYFHHVLKKNGIVFLGTSESINKYINLFSILDKKWNIFKKKEQLAPPPLEFYITIPKKEFYSKDVIMGKQANGETDFHDYVEKTLLHDYTPVCLLVDQKFNILYFHNKTSKFFEPPVGEARLNALNMAREGLKLPLNIAIREAMSSGSEVCSNGIKIKYNESYLVVNLIVRPVTNMFPETRVFLVIITDITSPDNLGKAALLNDGDNQYLEKIGELEKELDSTKEYLQSAFDDLETTNEELKSTNEELQSSNEELQSTNEELLSLNMDYENKIEELTHSNDDMSNFLASTNIATIFLDSHFLIKRFTPQVRRIINLIETDIGRPLNHIASKLVDYQEFTQDADDVLKSLQPKEIKVRAKDKQIYQMRILPYRTLKDKIDGVVITFMDITVLHNTEKSLQQRLEFEQCIADISTEFINMPLDRIDSGINVALGKIARFFDAVRSSLYIYSDERHTFSNTHEWALHAEDSLLAELKNIPFEEFGSHAAPLNRFETVIISRPDDLSAGGRQCSGIEAEGFRALIYIPLVYKNKLYGILGFYGAAGKEIDWPEVYVHLLKFVGSILINTLERQMAEQSIKESQARWRSLTENSPDFVTLLDLELNILYVNNALYPNLPFEQIQGTPVYEYMPETMRLDIKQKLSQIVETKQPALYETEYVNPDGSIIYYETHAVPREIDGRLSGLTLHTRNITQRKKMEMNLLLALKEKEVLINDIHHRVKNNLALLVSLLFLEKNKLSSQQPVIPEYMNVFENCISRINILSIIYTHLYQTKKNIDTIECKSFISKLLSLIRSSYSKMKNIDIVSDIDDIILSSVQGIPLGLIINEALTNSYKYGFPGNANGHIYFFLKVAAEKIYLEMRDDGIGIQGDLEELKSKTLGLMLMDSLVQQLHGQIEMTTNAGVTIKINFNR